MHRIRVGVAIAAGVGLPALSPGAPPAVRPPMVPSDLGATVIEVASYPGEFQQTYRELFLTKCSFCHTAARAINAPYLEVPPEQVPAYHSHPPSETPQGLVVSDDIWQAYVARMWRRPPCCDRCPTFTRAEAVRLWRFLVYDSIRRKTGDRAAAWAAHRRRLRQQFAQRTGGHDAHARRSPAHARPDRPDDTGDGRLAGGGRPPDPGP